MSGDTQVVAMMDRYATGDFSGALVVAEGILDAHPQHEEARRCRERCTEVLSQMYLARLGSLAQVVRVALSGDEIRWLSLDHRAGFLLSLVDGASSIENLLDIISGMPRLEALPHPLRLRSISVSSPCPKGDRVREVLGGVLATALGLGLLNATSALLPAAAAVDAARPARAERRAALAHRTVESGLGQPRACRPRSPFVQDRSATRRGPRHRVEGKERITFRNASARALPELFFHLYLNAFKNEKSVFLRSPFGEGRSGARPEDWGYVDVLHCTAPALGPGDLWAAHTNGTPGEPDDETDIRLPLPAALAPGESITLELEWSAKLPAIVLRTGYAGDFHFVGQWFPKLAKLEPDGTFAHFPFHAQAEFYADYGDYDVTLDVPKNDVVGATGARVSTSTHGDRRSGRRYVVNGVHDFAWTAWPDFRERDATVDGVAVRLLYPPDQESSADTTLTALRYALPRASALYGRYPYPDAHGRAPRPERAGEAGGMEYPTLITDDGRRSLARELERHAGHRVRDRLTSFCISGSMGSSARTRARFPLSRRRLHELRGAPHPLTLASEQAPAFHGFGLELSVTSLGRAFAAARAEDLPVSSAAADFPSFRSLRGSRLFTHGDDPSKRSRACTGATVSRPRSALMRVVTASPGIHAPEDFRGGDWRARRRGREARARRGARRAWAREFSRSRAAERARAPACRRVRSKERPRNGRHAEPARGAVPLARRDPASRHARAAGRYRYRR